jgi:hypothetical protein
MLATIPVNLSPDDFESLCDTAGYAISYWVSAAVASSEVYRVLEDEENEWHTVTRSHLIHTIAEVISGKYDLSDRIRQSVTYAITTSDIGDLDGYDVDALIQLAIFKEIVYG